MPHQHPAGSHGIQLDSPGDRRRLSAALALVVGLMAVEITSGVLAQSLALLSDAAHMLTDAGAIAFSLLALRLAARPAKGAMTFGFRRAEILSAQANGATLLTLAAFILYGAIGRLLNPPSADGTVMLAVAMLGVVVNLAATWVLAGADRRSAAIEGSFQHIITDLYAFIGTAAAAAVILLSGFERADAIASLVIAGLMIRSGLSLVTSSARVFLEAAPEGLDPEVIGRSLVQQPTVLEVHDLHVWEISSGFPALSAHVLVGRDHDCHAARRAMEEMLHERFGLHHTTLQVDHAGGGLIELEAPVRAHDSSEHSREALA
jgi:cobalt-zinc-cadmium efflux system protein